MRNSCDQRRLTDGGHGRFGRKSPNFSNSRLNTCRCCNKTVFCWLMAANRRNFKSVRVFNWIRTCGLVMASQRNDANHVQKVEES